MDKTINPAGYPEKVWNGKEPAHAGSEWIFRDKHFIGKCYETYFGSFETIMDDFILAKGEMMFDGTEITVCGLSNPWMRVTNVQKNIYLDSREDAPRELASHFIREYRKNRPIFETALGQMFMERVCSILSYSFPLKFRGRKWVIEDEDGIL